MMDTPKRLLLCICLLSMLGLNAQRTYSNSSVLATGNWYQFSVDGPGVYKLDVSFLNSLGISGTIPSAQLRVYGNGGAMLSEANSSKPIDDLYENAVQVVDGGDGVLNGSDYVLLFAQGPHQWLKDSAARRFSHRKNLYAERSYYFITIGGNGKRIATQTIVPSASVTVTSFDERYFHELDSVNFLWSGKEWWGEEFSSAPGRSLSRIFTLPFTDVLTGTQATIVTNVAARSVNTPSRFSVAINGQPLQQLNVNAITTGPYDLFAQQTQRTDNFTAVANPTLQINYVPGSFNSQGWLNWFEVFCRRSLVFSAGKQLLFRDWNSVGISGVEFVVAGADAAAQIWDVTDPLQPVKMNAATNAGALRFVNDGLRLREYVCFGTAFLTPRVEGRIANQNLHNSQNRDYLIVSHPDFLPQAQRLAQHHQQRNGLSVVVVTTQQVFNEFASGTPDPTAIRDFVKMYFDKYNSTWAQKGKYLLLLGKASFDYKDRLRNNTSLVPAYQSVSSIDPLSTYTSDDFFGFLEDAEDINSGVIINTLDIGIGRVPARTPAEAKNFVDKVIAYHSSAAYGPWRTNINLIADDEDFNLHLQDAETLSVTTSTTNPLFNQQKIYLDAFQQESGSAGGRYPQANAAVNSNIFNGTLIWNYSGHGGPLRLAEEVVIDQSIVNNWQNQNRLPLFITATCDFAPYDNPTANSLGENLLVRPLTGAIALMTTTRVVFAFSNRVMNDNYLKVALRSDALGRYKTLGEAVRDAKNLTYQTFSDITNNRKFALLGDPALTLGFPSFTVAATKVNGKDITSATDTLNAVEDVLLEGEVRDNTGTLMPSFNGTAFLSLFDKPKTVTTLANDATSQPANFSEQSNALFRGKATVQNGKFAIRFKMPKDINYQFGPGKISLYAHDGSREGAGFSNNVSIGGISNALITDNTGPEIKAFLNDEKFVNGSITNNNPILLVQLADSSGINTGGAGIDHDIVATLDGDNNQYFVLNAFYESELDNFRQGKIRFQLPQLKPGPHSLKIKAWDAVNNSSEYVLDFVVVESSELRIDHVLNYPNPFTTNTSFWFEHNQPGRSLYARVEVFTVSGKLIKSLSQTINTSGNRSSDIRWDGLDDWGQKIGRGVYLYRLLVRTEDGKTAQQWQRLVIL
jgi:hypothetical protein